MKSPNKCKALIIFTASMMVLSCHHQSESSMGSRSFTDACGRIVTIPDTIGSVIALKSGALRLLSYLDLADRVSHIEGNEQRRSVPYLFANPHLRDLPVIGTGNNHDPELLAASSADLIVATFMTCSEADKLQAVTKKPVIVVKYGNLGESKADLYTSLSLLGEIFHRPGRADSIINFFETNLNDIQARTSGYSSQGATVYVGGVAYNGSHGISSTVPAYPPFKTLPVRNVAESLLNITGYAGASHHNTMIDPEQLIEWDPDYIFLDASGEAIWQDEIRKPFLIRTLRAFRNAKAFRILPYIWFTINYENILCNAWFIGKTIYPEAFTDISIEMKCREIYEYILGSDVYDDIVNLYRPYTIVLSDSTGMND